MLCLKPYSSAIHGEVKYFSVFYTFHIKVSDTIQYLRIAVFVSSGRNILILRGGLTKVFLFILTKFHLSPMPVCTRAMYSCATWKNLFHQPHLDLSHNSVCISCPKPKNHKDPGRLSHSQKQEGVNLSLTCKIICLKPENLKYLNVVFSSFFNLTLCGGLLCCSHFNCCWLHQLWGLVLCFPLLPLKSFSSYSPLK